MEILSPAHFVFPRQTWVLTFTTNNLIAFYFDRRSLFENIFHSDGYFLVALQSSERGAFAGAADR